MRRCKPHEARPDRLSSPGPLTSLGPTPAVGVVVAHCHDIAHLLGTTNAAMRTYVLDPTSSGGGHCMGRGDWLGSLPNALLRVSRQRMYPAIWYEGQTPDGFERHLLRSAKPDLCQAEDVGRSRWIQGRC